MQENFEFGAAGWNAISVARKIVSVSLFPIVVLSKSHIVSQI
jgi:hypothetical protein